MTTDLLKKIYLADAASCAAFFALFVLATGKVSTLLGIDAGIITAGGWICLGAAALLAWLGTRATPPALLAWLVVFLNIDWMIASVIVFELEFATLTALGRVVILAQAAGVLGFVALEAAGARTLPRNRARATA